MNIIELFSLTVWFEEEVIKSGLQTKYDELVAVLNQNLTIRPNLQLQSFENQKNTLVEAVRGINPFSLSEEQVNVLQKYSISKLLGSSAANELEELFYKKGLDLSTICKDLQDQLNILNQAIVKISQLKNDLLMLVDQEHLNFEKDEAIIKVHFVNKALITNITDLKKWSSDWYDISRGIALSQEMTPESIKIISAEKGSIIITLGVAFGLVEIISKIILRVLEVAEKSMDIIKKAEEIKSLNLTNKKIASDIEIEAKEYKEKQIEDIIKEFSYKHADGEKKNALELSLKKLIDFVQLGGKVDCFLPDPVIDTENNDTTSEKISLIRSNFIRIRNMSDEIKKIDFTNKTDS